MFEKKLSFKSPADYLGFLQFIAGRTNKRYTLTPDPKFNLKKQKDGVPFVVSFEFSVTGRGSSMVQAVLFGGHLLQYFGVNHDVFAPVPADFPQKEFVEKSLQILEGMKKPAEIIRAYCLFLIFDAPANMEGILPFMLQWADVMAKGFDSGFLTEAELSKQLDLMVLKLTSL